MCQLLGTPPSWDTLGDKDNTAHPTLPTCPPGPPVPQHTGAPLGVVAASPLRTHDLGDTQGLAALPAPRCSPCPKHPNPYPLAPVAWAPESHQLGGLQCARGLP